MCLYTKCSKCHQTHSEKHNCPIHRNTKFNYCLDCGQVKPYRINVCYHKRQTFWNFFFG